jgi:hypothetical protein
VKKILIFIAVVVFALIVIISLQPSEFRVSRSLLIPAPSSVIFEQVNDFHNWEAWSPWVKLDPKAKAIYEGPSSGVNATFKWAGNDKIGEGRETIIVSQPDLIRIELEFIKPFKGTNTAEFSFISQGDQTLVTWTMLGKKNFMAKAMGLFMNCDRMVGGQFEEGLANLKAVVAEHLRPIYTIATGDEQPQEIKDNLILAEVMPLMDSVPELTAKTVECNRAIAATLPTEEAMQAAQVQCACESWRIVLKFAEREQEILKNYPDLVGKKISFEDRVNKSGYSYVLGNNICQKADAIKPAEPESAKEENKNITD